MNAEISWWGWGVAWHTLHMVTPHPQKPCQASCLSICISIFQASLGDALTWGNSTPALSEVAAPCLTLVWAVQAQKSQRYTLSCCETLASLLRVQAPLI